MPQGLTVFRNTGKNEKEVVASFKVKYPLGVDLKGCNLLAIETLDKQVTF